MSLASIAVAGGTTLGAVAVACRVKVELLEQVDLHRLALPVEIASRIAIVLGLQRAEVIHEVSRVCTAVNATTGRSILEDACQPMPPVLGDQIAGALLAPTLPVVPP